MRIDPGYKDVTQEIFKDNRDERVARQVRQCWDEEQLKGWQSTQSASHKVKSRRRKVQ
jgi:hypothetical protein